MLPLKTMAMPSFSAAVISLDARTMALLAIVDGLGCDNVSRVVADGHLTALHFGSDIAIAIVVVFATGAHQCESAEKRQTKKCFLHNDDF